MKTFNLTRLLCCLATASMLFFAQAASSENAISGSVYNIIPIPANIQPGKGTFTLTEQGAKVYVQGASAAFSNYIQQSALKCKVTKKRSDANIAIVVGSKASKKIATEGYFLTISP